MYWVPLMPLNNKWTGLALPLPITFNTNYCIIKNNTYSLPVNKIFTTPSTLCNFDSFTFDLDFSKNFLNFKGIKISLAGRLKGISKAKSFKITQGIIKPQSINNKLDYYSRPIYTKWGTIGLKVIC